MSSKQRRVNAPPPAAAPSFSPPVQNNSRPVDLTLPQVLQLLESRLRKLEQVKVVPDLATTTPAKTYDDVISSLQSEYDSRFDMLATEINQMKDIVLKLQSYTMDVNKTLLEERVHFMADLSDVKENIVMETTTIAEEDEEDA